MLIAIAVKKNKQNLKHQKQSTKQMPRRFACRQGKTCYGSKLADVYQCAELDG
jgi:hypothetical protein